MKVRSIALTQFMSHAGTEVRLPDTGLVVFTGTNGSGKSSVIEAVATACWGRSLRGGPGGWRKGVHGSVRAQVGGLEVTRTCDKRGAKSLVWARVNQDQPCVYDTTTKAQDALEHEIGSFDQWRRTHVFSSQDAAHFSLATDAERKALLEELLGLDRFDSALQACADDLSLAVGQAQTHQLLRERLAERYRSLKVALDTAAPEEAQPVSTVTTADFDVAASFVAAVANEEAARLALNAHFHSGRAHPSPAFDVAVAVAVRDAKQARDRVAQLEAGECPTCLQACDAQHLVDFREELADCDALVVRRTEARAAEAARVTAELELHRVEGVSLKAEHESWCRAVSAAREAQARIVSDQRDLTLWETRKLQSEGRRAELLRLWGVAADELDVSEDAMVGTAQQVAHLQAVKEVLGLRGARVRVLGQALEGVEAVANVWLSRFFSGPVSLRLNPTSTLKSGREVGAIGLEVSGVGGGIGYPGLSGGERRRVDAALLMALAEVAAAAAGREPGTVFLDEVFDALDQPGIDAVQRELAQLSQKRCVVLITHSTELVSGLQSAQVWHVDGGHVR